MKYTTQRDPDTGLLRIIAARTFTTPAAHIIHKGQQGGLISNPDNLSQHGTCWIFPDARAIEGAQVMHGATLTGTTTASGAALITDRATVRDSTIDGQAVVTNSAYVVYCTITDRARAQGNANVRHTTMTDDATLGGFCYVEHCTLGGFAWLDGTTRAYHSAHRARQPLRHVALRRARRHSPAHAQWRNPSGFSAQPIKTHRKRLVRPCQAMNIYKALIALPNAQRIIFTPTEAYAISDKAIMRLELAHYAFQIEAPIELLKPWPKTLTTLTYRTGSAIALADDNPIAVVPATPPEDEFLRPALQVQDTPVRNLETFTTILKALHGRNAKRLLVSIHLGRPTRFTASILTLLI